MKVKERLNESLKKVGIDEEWMLEEEELYWDLPIYVFLPKRKSSPHCVIWVYRVLLNLHYMLCIHPFLITELYLHAGNFNFSKKRATSRSLKEKVDNLVTAHQTGDRLWNLNWIELLTSRTKITWLKER